MNLKTIKTYAIRNRSMSLAKKDKFERLMGVYGIEPGENQVNLSELFNKKKPTILEIGFGDGNNLFYQAKHFPTFNFLGIEVYQQGIYSLLVNLEKEKLTNLKIIHKDARKVISQNIADSSIIRAHIYFPDPWPKKKHNKRRLITNEFLDELERIILFGGILHIVTDWQSYAEQISSILTNRKGFQLIEPKYNNKFSLEKIKTKYELKGKMLGHNIWECCYQKV